MTGRLVTLNAAKGGINRLRVKGGADSGSLYDLVNGYVDQAGVMRARPGNVGKASLPEGTKDMCAYDGKLIVFSHVKQEIPYSTPVVECEVLSHPSIAEEPIKEIHFAGPFLGYLYVVAEFDNGDVYHYWLEKGSTWEANKAYLPGALVTPTTPNGIAYRLSGGTQAFPEWVRNVARSLGDVIVPTVDNGYKYTATEVFGPAPKSGAVEPNWPTADGATIYEDSDLAVPGMIGSGQGGATLPPEVADRYGSARVPSGNTSQVIP